MPPCLRGSGRLRREGNDDTWNISNSKTLFMLRCVVRAI